MLQAASDAEPLTIDLTGLATSRQREIRGRRLLVLFLVALFLAVGCVGLFLIVYPTGGGGPALTPGPAVLVTFGFLIAGEGWYVSTGYKESPHRVTVTSQCASFEDASRQLTFQLDWDNPNLRFRLYDLSQLPPMLRDGKARTTEFSLEPPRGPRSPIPRNVYEAIVNQVEAHHLRQVRRDVPGRSGGKIVITLVEGVSR
jgi:hypothetical protein